MNTAPGKSGKLYYSIGEVAEMFNLNTSHIRYWEKEFDIIKPQKNRKGNRYFTKEDIDSIRIIYHLVKNQGYTLDGAKKVLKENRDEAEKKMQVVESLSKIKSFLLEIEKQL